MRMRVEGGGLPPKQYEEELTMHSSFEQLVKDILLTWVSRAEKAEASNTKMTKALIEIASTSESDHGAVVYKEIARRALRESE